MKNKQIIAASLCLCIAALSACGNVNNESSSEITTVQSQADISSSAAESEKTEAEPVGEIEGKDDGGDESEGESSQQESEAEQLVTMADVVDDSFETQALTLSQTADNTFETSDGAVTFTVSGTADEDGGYEFSTVIKNNTQTAFYLDISGMQGGGYRPDEASTVLAVGNTLYTLDPEEETSAELFYTGIAEEDQLAVKFSGVSIIDPADKILYEIEYAMFPLV